MVLTNWNCRVDIVGDFVLNVLSGGSSLMFVNVQNGLPLGGRILVDENCLSLYGIKCGVKKDPILTGVACFSTLSGGRDVEPLAAIKFRDILSALSNRG